MLKPAPKLTPELQNIDWNAPALLIHNLVRGLSPYPAAYTYIQKEGAEPQLLKIFASAVVAAPENLPAGTILSDGKSSLSIVCGDGNALELKDVQLQGKKRMPVGDFLRGWRDAGLYKALCGTSAAEIARLKEKK